MSNSAQPTPRELEVLTILWEKGEATVREVYERMRLQEENLAQNTVQTFLRVMEDKGLVRHDTKGRAFVYQPVYSREQSVASFLEKVFRGAADQLVVSLLQSRRLRPEEIDSIEAMIRKQRQREQRRRK